MDLTKLKNDALSITNTLSLLKQSCFCVVEVIRRSLLSGCLVLICSYV